MKTASLVTIFVSLLAFTAKASPYSYMQDNQFYVQFSGGANFTNIDMNNSTNAAVESLDTSGGFGLSAAIGRKFNQFRVELEYGYRRNEGDVVAAGAAIATADVSMHNLMVNLLYEVPVGDLFYFYAGGGLGVGFAQFEQSGSDVDTTFVYQALVGFGYNFNQDVSLLLGYRHLRTTDLSFGIGGTTHGIDAFAYNGFELGLRFQF